MDNKNKIRIFNFNEAYEPPKYKIDKQLNIVKWGEKNDYPQYLLDLYNFYGSTIHKSIINRKSKMISGKGFNDILDDRLKEFVKRNKLESEVKKATLDYEIFNGFAFEIIWNIDGTEIASISHINLHKLRLGIKSKEMAFDHYLFSNDWSQYKKDMYIPEPIRAFNPNNRSGKQIYFYTEYNPADIIGYPIQAYSTSMNWIELEYEISKFHLNQAKQGYSPSFILNFSTGIPTEEEQDENYKAFERNYSGTSNTGKIILTYSEGQDGAPKLEMIPLNDSDERFIMLMEQIDNKIVQGSEIPPQLIILTPGKLGSTDERKELMVEFQESYITPRQENIEDVLNEILILNGYDEEIKLKQYNEI